MRVNQVFRSLGFQKEDLYGSEEKRALEQETLYQFRGLFSTEREISLLLLFVDYYMLGENIARQEKTGNIKYKVQMGSVSVKSVELCERQTDRK